MKRQQLPLNLNYKNAAAEEDTQPYIRPVLSEDRKSYHKRKHSFQYTMKEKVKKELKNILEQLK